MGPCDGFGPAMGWAPTEDLRSRYTFARERRQGGVVRRGAPWEEMALQLPHLATHCQEAWLKWLRAPTRVQVAIGDRCLMSYFPRPRGGGQALQDTPGPRKMGALAAPGRGGPKGEGGGTSSWVLPAAAVPPPCAAAPAAPHGAAPGPFSQGEAHSTRLVVRGCRKRLADKGLVIHG